MEETAEEERWELKRRQAELELAKAKARLARAKLGPPPEQQHWERKERLMAYTIALWAVALTMSFFLLWSPYWPAGVLLAVGSAVGSLISIGLANRYGNEAMRVWEKWSDELERS